VPKRGTRHTGDVNTDGIGEVLKDLVLLQPVAFLNVGKERLEREGERDEKR